MSKAIRNLKIRAKLYILVGIALAGMLLIGGMSFSLMRTMNDNTTDIATSWLPSVDAGRHMTAVLSNARLSELSYLTSLAEEAKESSLRTLERAKDEMSSLLAEYGGMIDEEERPFYDEASALWSAYEEADSRLIELARAGRAEETRSVFDGESAQLYARLNDALDEIVACNLEGSEDITVSSESTYRNAVLLLSGIMIATIVIGVVFSFIVIRGINTPAREIKDAMSEMAKGNLSAEISYTSRDELGILADETRALVRKLHAIIDDEDQMLSRMASGDFTATSSCESEYTGDFHPLLVSLTKISEELNRTMRQIGESRGLSVPA